MNNKKIFIFTVLAVLLIFAYFNQNLTGENNLTPNSDLNLLKTAETNTKNEKNKQLIIVHLSGAVKNAGVYELKTNSRLVDLIKLAGGLKEEADLAKINLAEEIFDGRKIVIPKLAAEDNLFKAEGEFLQLSSGAANSTNYAFGQDNELININQASQASIEKLNGIGPAKAAAIIKYREDNGHFSEKEELLKVSGIGEKTLANIEAEIRLR